MVIAVRPAHVGDVTGIASVQIQAWKVGYAHIYPSSVLDALSLPDRVASWAEQVMGEQVCVWVAGTPGVDGFVSVGNARDDDRPGAAEVFALYVRPDRWAAGLGSALLDEALSWLAPRFTTAVLWVLADNDRARGFYERRGWRADGTVKEDRRGEMTITVVRYSATLVDREQPPRPPRPPSPS